MTHPATPSQYHNRRSMRMAGYDYSQSGAYHIVICTHKRRCMFGDVKDQQIHLSEIGKIADAEWNAISNHYSHVTVDTHCMMPNHIHGIIIIHSAQSRCHPPHRSREFAKPIAGSLSTIIGSYKAGVTRKVRAARLHYSRHLWQPRFYDHIIRDDIDFYLTRQYIELNPLFWEYDTTNPSPRSVSMEELERLLRDRCSIDGKALYGIMTSRKIDRIKNG